ncbi:hypothetical protein Psuf_024000 [Phytohabitans suffuscus]|uniref:7,8-didemethyl-8-hydroxy-5-deazariboflavin synthase n=1 Tax=Phytohabitans suffuscus TaxID=624315 RepID=A0A6F8YG94_9ACTN|nr:hypothetical protein Psuf_024000 [Phytohabitans suffuscus]
MADHNDAPPTEASLRRALHRAADGRALDVDEAATLLTARGEPLDQLLAIAGGVRDAGLRDAGRPGVVTFSKNVFIPLTRLCRDRCHYCTFATVPHRLPAAFLERDEVLQIARDGAAQGCKEALFTLGDRPEERWPAAREWLHERGYDSTLDYVRASAIAVLEETGLLPHLNPGVLSWADLQRLKPVAASMGMMLETTATRLWSEPGGPHYGSPDKEPAVRLRVLEDAGRVGVPFTTGILIGIGETLAERADSLFAIRRVARQYGHIQEVIVQNFRAKPDTAMRGMPDAELHDLAATVAVARILLGPRARIQAPPNLIAGEYDLLLRAGIDDWGGVSPVTPDHVSPERPWPQIEELARHTAAAGFTMRERLAVYPEYVVRGDPWLDPRVLPHVAALSLDSGLADPEAAPTGHPWQEPDDTVASGRVDLHKEIDTEGRTEDRRGDFDSVYGDWSLVRDSVGVPSGAPHHELPDQLREGLRLAGSRPGSLLLPRNEGRRWRCSGRTVRRSTSCAGSRTGCGGRRSATTSRTSSTATSTSPTSATWGAASARSPSASGTPTPTGSPWSRWPTGPRRRGGPARPRCACRVASTPSCRSPCTPTWCVRSRSGCRGCTSTRSRRWRS